MLADPRHRLSVTFMTGRGLYLRTYELGRVTLPIALHLKLGKRRVRLARLKQELRRRAFTRGNAYRGHTQITFLRNQVSDGNTNGINGRTDTTHQVTRHIVRRVLMRQDLSYLQGARLLQLRDFDRYRLPPYFRYHYQSYVPRFRWFYC